MSEFLNLPNRTHLDLFSGIGGFALAAKWNGLETIAFCEIEKYAQKVLAKNFPGIPIYDDIRKLDGTKFRPFLLTGGFPCQPFSVAGEQRGAADDRHLWPEMLRIIKECKPTWILGENVAGFISMELDNSLSDMEAEGYECGAFVIPACALDAKHRRDRVWIVANRNSSAARQQGGRPCGQSENGCQAQLWPEAGNGLTNLCQNVADTNSAGLQAQGAKQQAAGLEQCGYVANPNQVGLQKLHTSTSSNEQRFNTWCSYEGGHIWEPEPPVGRVADGVPNRSHRLKGLGNAIVPQVAAEIIRNIILTEQYFSKSIAIPLLKQL